jgi:hypothetical protein
MYVWCNDTLDVSMALDDECVAVAAVRAGRPELYYK